MWPAIPSGSLLEVTPCPPEGLAIGDVAAYERGGRVVVHRVLDKNAQGIVFVADALSQGDATVAHAAVLGRARLVEARGLTRRLPSASEVLVLGRGLARRLQSSVRRALRRVPRGAA